MAPSTHRHSPHPNASQASEAPGSSTPLKRDMHPLKSHLSSAITGVTSTAFKKCQRASIRQINLFSPETLYYHSKETTWRTFLPVQKHVKRSSTCKKASSPSERTRSSSMSQSRLAHTLAVSRVSWYPCCITLFFLKNFNLFQLFYFIPKILFPCLCNQNTFSYVSWWCTMLYLQTACSIFCLSF